MSTWNPIETAPKAGTPILVGCWEARDRWNPTTREYEALPPTWKAVTVFWCAYKNQDTPGDWTLVETGAYAEEYAPSLDVTHWTEIPTPPPHSHEA